MSSLQYIKEKLCVVESAMSNMISCSEADMNVIGGLEQIVKSIRRDVDILYSGESEEEVAGPDTEDAEE